MKKKIIGVLVCTLLIATFLPVSSRVIEFNNISNFNQNYINQPNDRNPPLIPGDMSFPYPDFNEIDTSQKKSVPPKIFSQFTNDEIIDMIQAMDESMILGYLENLTAFGPRVTGTSECHEAGDYIYDEFESMGLEVRYHHWNYEGYQDRNIEATLHGINETSDEIYIVCAHYDSVPGSPGADDDGSGVAATMSAAFIMSQYGFNHTVRFVTFSGEEQGLLGSHEYVEEAYANGDNIIAVLNVDMIGFAITTYHGNNIKVYHNDASIWLTEFTIPSGYSWGSDHYYFWEYGYDALFYAEYEFNYYYHSPQDTIQNMNITYATKCSKLVLAILVELAQIANCPPEAPSIDGPVSGIVGMEHEYSFSTNDPDEDDVYYYIEWGDGQVEEWIGSYGSGEEATVSHTWTSPDDYEIRVKAKDTNDLESEWSVVYPVIIVENEPPNAPTIDGPGRGSAGTSYEYTFISTDPNEDQVSYYIKWDDGSITDWTAFQASGPPGYSESHTWDEQGTYTIEVKAKDTYGVESDWAELEVTMPRNKIATNNVFQTLFKHFSNLFPILQMLLHRLGLQ
jgi:hypothetical protein